jgi:peptide alpha-N-acetyltransferase
MGSQTLLETISNDSDDRISELTYHLKEKLSVKDGHTLNGCVNVGENGVIHYRDSVLGTQKYNRNDSLNTKAIQIKNSSQDTQELTHGTCNQHEAHCNNTDRTAHICMNELTESVSNDSEDLTLNPFIYLTSSKEVSINSDILYKGYESELQMPDIMRLIQKDLSEPYSVYTYRYFIHNWPKLCFLAMQEQRCVGAVVCKLDIHKKIVRRGYIAMLAVDENCRKRKIGTNLVLKAIQAMMMDDADEIVLETEISNKPALQLYENLGFVRDKRLFRYYLNGVDALRLKLWLR